MQVRVNAPDNKRKCQQGCHGMASSILHTMYSKRRNHEKMLLMLLLPLLAICQRQLAIEPLFSCPCIYDNCAFHLIRKLMSNSISGRTRPHTIATAVTHCRKVTWTYAISLRGCAEKEHIQCRALTSVCCSGFVSNLFPIWLLLKIKLISFWYNAIFFFLVARTEFRLLFEACPGIDC